MIKESKTILILMHDVSSDHDAVGMFPSATRLIVRGEEVAISMVRDRLAEAIEAIQSLVESLPQDSRTYPVESITFNLGIDTTGKIGLVGEISAGCHTGISVTLQRQRER